MSDMSMKYTTIMTAEQAPDLYDGRECDEVRPLWVGSAEGDKSCPSAVGDNTGLVSFNPAHYPAGTRILVQVPDCPDCTEPAPSGQDVSDRCSCGFNWELWMESQYS